MKKNYLAISIFFAAFSMSAQTVIFNEDFESVSTPSVAATLTSPPMTIYGGDIPNGWAQFNVDGYGQIVSSSTTLDDFMGNYGFRILDHPAYGTKAAFTRSSPDNGGIATVTDDVLRTPSISIPNSSGNTSLSFKLSSPNTYMDSVHVYVSNSSILSGTEDLVFSKKNPISSGGLSFSTFNVDISSFEGQSIYVFFEAFDKASSNSNSGYLYIDNIKVTTDLATSISEKQVSQNFIIYPNPCNNSLTINSNDLDDKCVLTILDISGKQVFNAELFEKSNTVDISFLTSGFYFATITSDNNKVSYKLIKQ